MADNGILIDLGLDLTPFTRAGAIVTATMGDLNRITKSSEEQSRSANENQLSRIKAMAQEAVAGAMREVDAGKEKQKTLEAQLAELQKQLSEYKALTDQAQQSLASENKRLEVLSAQTEQLRVQLLEAKKVHEEGGSSLLGKTIQGGARELFGGGLGGAVVAGLAGGGTVVAIEAAAQAVERFIGKLREITIESSKLTLIQDQFERIAKAAGIDAPQMLNKMREATEGLVGKQELMKLSSTAIKSPFGLSVEQVQTLTGAVVKLAEANGHTAVDGVNALTRAMEVGTLRTVTHTLGLSRLTMQLDVMQQGMGRVASRTTEMQHGFQVITKEADKLGEQPETLERIMTRLSVSWNDLLKDFGRGFNLSAGLQVAAGLLKDLGGNLNDLDGTATKLGQKFGNLFSALVIGIRSSVPVARELFGVFSDLVSVVGSLVSGVGGAVGELSSAASRASKSNAAEQLHPVMSQLVRTMIEFNKVLTIAVGMIHLMSHEIAARFGGSQLASAVDAAAPVALGIAGAQLAGPWGAMIGTGAGVVLSELGSMQRKERDALQRGTPKSPSPEAEAIIARAKEMRPRPLGKGIEITGAPQLPAGVGVQSGEYTGPQSISDLVQRANNTAEQSYKDYLARLAEADAAAKKARSGITKPDVSDTGQRRKEIIAKAKEADQAAQVALDEARRKLASESQKTQLDELTSFFDIEKARWQEYYQDGILQASDYYSRLDTLSEQAHKARLAKIAVDEDEAAKVHTDKVKEFTDKAEALHVEQPRLLPEAYNYQMAALGKQAAAMEVAYQAQQLGFQDQRVKENENYTKQTSQRQLEQDKDANAAEISQIQAQAQRIKEAMQEAQKTTEFQFSKQQISPDVYLAQRLDQIQKEADFEIAKANDVYESKKKDLVSLQELTNAFNKANDDANRQTLDLTRDIIEKMVQSRSALHGAAQKYFESSGQVQLGFGGAGVLNAAQSQLQNAYGQRSDLIFGQQAEEKFGGGAGSTYWLQLGSQINDTNKQIQDLVQRIKDMTDAAALAGNALQIVSQGMQSVFHSKFAQNLAGQLTGAAKDLAGSTNLGEKIAGGSWSPWSEPNAQGVQTSTWKSNATGDPIKDFTNQLQASVQALVGFIGALTNSKNAITGGLAGGVAGAGLGQSVGTALGATGPGGMLAGAGLGIISGIITGQKNAEVTNNINNMQASFKTLMNQFQQNTNNLNSTIQQLQSLVAAAEQMQASSKKGSAQYQQVIDQYNQQLMSLQDQQIQVTRQMNEQIAILSEPVGAQSYLNTLQQILQQYQQFEGAAQSATDLANANIFLTQSLQQYEQTVGTQLLQDNTQAINDALQLNDLLLQRSQMILQYNNQVQSVLSQGVLTRQMTRAQTAGEQIEQLQITYQQQMDQINEQISAAQYRVNAESQIFQIATTRIGLETQLLALQNAQTNLDMQRISALQALVTQLESGDFSSGAVGALLTAMPTVTTANGAQATSLVSVIQALTAPGSTSNLNDALTTLLESMVAGAYQNRASAGNASFRAQNLS